VTYLTIRWSDDVFKQEERVRRQKMLTKRLRGTASAISVKDVRLTRPSTVDACINRILALSGDEKK
jgi:hypothetical protein